MSGREIVAGGAVDLNMVVNTRNVLNDWTVVCTLITDDPGRAEWTYRLTYRTYPSLGFEAERVDLGEIELTQLGKPSMPRQRSAWLNVYEPVDRRSASPVDLAAHSPLTAAFQSDAVADLIDGGQVRRTRRRVTVGLDPQQGLSTTDALQSGKVTATTLDGFTATATATWSVTSPLTVAPSNLSFGLVKDAAERVTRKVIVRSKGDRPFRVLAVRSDAEDVTVDNLARLKEGEPTATQVVELSFHKARADRRFVAGQATIETDHPEMPTARISWSAITP